MGNKNKSNKENDAGRPGDKFSRYLSSLSAPPGKGKDAAWDDLLQAIDEREKEKSPGIARFRHKVRTRVYARYAAIAAILIVVSILAVIVSLPGGEKSIDTARGEVLSLSLPDQTEVILNSESRITYRRRGWEKERLVSLSGEAYFNVVDGSVFSVFFETGSVRVVGTSFNLYARDNNFEVYCSSGTILVESEATKISEKLESGEGLRSKTTEEGYEVTRFRMPYEKGAAWIRGEFYYENAPLGSVFREIERQFDITINAPDVDLNRRYTGLFRRENLEEALDMVCIPMNLDYIRTGEREVTVK